jgi:hypothetical protein
MGLGSALGAQWVTHPDQAIGSVGAGVGSGQYSPEP